MFCPLKGRCRLFCQAEIAGGQVLVFPLAKKLKYFQSFFVGDFNFLISFFRFIIFNSRSTVSRRNLSISLICSSSSLVRDRMVVSWPSIISWSWRVRALTRISKISLASSMAARDFLSSTTISLKVPINSLISVWWLFSILTSKFPFLTCSQAAVSLVKGTITTRRKIKRTVTKSTEPIMVKKRLSTKIKAKLTVATKKKIKKTRKDKEYFLG